MFHHLQVKYGSLAHPQLISKERFVFTVAVCTTLRFWVFMAVKVWVLNFLVYTTCNIYLDGTESFLRS